MLDRLDFANDVLDASDNRCATRSSAPASGVRAIEALKCHVQVAESPTHGRRVEQVELAALDLPPPSVAEQRVEATVVRDHRVPMRSHDRLRDRDTASASVGHHRVLELDTPALTPTVTPQHQLASRCVVTTQMSFIVPDLGRTAPRTARTPLIQQPDKVTLRLHPPIVAHAAQLGDATNQTVHDADSADLPRCTERCTSGCTAPGEPGTQAWYTCARRGPAGG